MLQASRLLACCCLCLQCAAAQLETRTEGPDERFLRLDANRNDWLSFDEFLHTDTSFERAKQQEFDLIDSNKDGSVSEAEFTRHFTARPEHSESARAQYFGQIFKDFDADGDLALSQREVENVLRLHFNLAPRVDLPAIFANFDRDRTGTLDLLEYMQFEAGYPVEAPTPRRRRRFFARPRNLASGRRATSLQQVSEGPAPPPVLLTRVRRTRQVTAPAPPPPPPVTSNDVFPPSRPTVSSRTQLADRKAQTRLARLSEEFFEGSGSDSADSDDSSSDESDESELLTADD